MIKASEFGDFSIINYEDSYWERFDFVPTLKEKPLPVYMEELVN
jgi:hypothetical protein